MRTRRSAIRKERRPLVVEQLESRSLLAAGPWFAPPNVSGNQFPNSPAAVLNVNAGQWRNAAPAWNTPKTFSAMAWPWTPAVASMRSTDVEIAKPASLPAANSATPPANQAETPLKSSPLGPGGFAGFWTNWRPMQTQIAVKPAPAASAGVYRPAPGLTFSPSSNSAADANAANKPALSNGVRLGPYRPWNFGWAYGFGSNLGMSVRTGFGFGGATFGGLGFNSFGFGTGINASNRANMSGASSNILNKIASPISSAREPQGLVNWHREMSSMAVKNLSAPTWFELDAVSTLGHAEDYLQTVARHRGSSTANSSSHGENSNEHIDQSTAPTDPLLSSDTLSEEEIWNDVFLHQLPQLCSSEQVRLHFSETDVPWQLDSSSIRRVQKFAETEPEKADAIALNRWKSSGLEGGLVVVANRQAWSTLTGEKVGWRGVSLEVDAGWHRDVTIAVAHDYSPYANTVSHDDIAADEPTQAKIASPSATESSGQWWMFFAAVLSLLGFFTEQRLSDIAKNCVTKTSSHLSKARRQHP